MKKISDARIKKLEKSIPDPKPNAEWIARRDADIDRGLRKLYPPKPGEAELPQLPPIEFEDALALIDKIYAEHPEENTAEFRAAAVKRSSEESREQFKRNQASRAGKAS